MLVAMNANAQWVQISNGMGLDKNIIPMIVNGNNIFAGSDSSNVGGRVYLSTNLGTNWIQTSFLNFPAWSLSSIGNNILAGTPGMGLLYSTNNGINWLQSSLVGRAVWSLTVTGSYVFAGTSQYGVYISSNNGVNWSQVNFNYNSVPSLTTIGTTIYAGTFGSGVFKSTNNGSNWTQTGLNNLDVRCLTVSGNNILAGTEFQGIFLSTNNGSNWTQTSLNDKHIYCITISGNNIFAGTDSFGVYVSTNFGISWTQKNQGLTNLRAVSSLLIIGNDIFAGTYGSSVWRRPLSEIIGIQNISTEIPSAFSLSQNYPNPFNPSTTIRFQVTGNSEVVIKVYDVQGREVQTLVNEKLQPGVYETSFDGSRLTSGVYFYKLIADGFTETKKMLLIK